MASGRPDWQTTAYVIDGSISISGTPTVTISGTPTVEISGTPSVTVSSGTVNATVSGTVSISGTTTIAIDQTGANNTVQITGTPSVSISGTPSVTISGTPTVEFATAQSVKFDTAQEVTITSGSVSITSGNVTVSGDVFLTGNNQEQHKVSVTDTSTQQTWTGATKAFLVYNDGPYPVHINFDAAATTDNFKIPSGASLSIDYASQDTRFICASGKTATVYAIGLY